MIENGESVEKFPSHLNAFELSTSVVQLADIPPH